eukprot:5637708-Amphidinium_carterae.1
MPLPALREQCRSHGATMVDIGNEASLLAWALADGVPQDTCKATVRDFQDWLCSPAHATAGSCLSSKRTTSRQ